MTNDLLEEWHKQAEWEKAERIRTLDPWHDAPNYTAHWLNQAQVTDDPEGDLIADMRTDPDIPHLFPTLKAMRAYVGRKSRNDPLVMAAVLGVWRRYRAWCRRYRIL
jgi:hypothetical protein